MKNRDRIMDMESVLMLPDGGGLGGIGDEVRGLRSTNR